MHFAVFENAYFLQSIGWAIINSFWQACSLWLVYIFIVSFNKETPAVFKYNLSLVLLFASFAWFILTIIETYYFLKNIPGIARPLYGLIQVINFLQFNNLLPWLSIFYAGLLCFYIIKFISNYIAVCSLKKNKLIKAPLDLRIFTKNIALHIGIKKKVQVWLSEQIDVPSVIGFIKPVILFPAAIINHLSTEQLEAVLLHELAHIQRNDYVTNLLQSVIGIALFFNPFAQLLSNYAKKERENCCDDWVLNYQYDKHKYASALLILEEQRRQQLLLAMAATNEKEILLNRVKRMFYTEPGANISPLQKFQLIAVAVLLFAGILFFFPFADKNNTGNKQLVYSTKKAISIIHPASNKKAFTVSVNNDQPGSKNVIAQKIPAKKTSINNADNGYTVAFINNELIKGNSKPVTIAANEDEIPDSSYYVKIEEEQSGQKQMNVYYFELKKDKGNTSIKPLILLSKPVDNIKAVIKKAVDSTLGASERITL